MVTTSLDAKPEGVQSELLKGPELSNCVWFFLHIVVIFLYSKINVVFSVGTTTVQLRRDRVQSSRQDVHDPIAFQQQLSG
jgi:hypothetical protein